MSELAGHGAVWTEERRGSETGYRRVNGASRRTPAARRRPGPRPAGRAPLRLVADGGRLVRQAPARGTGARHEPARAAARQRPASQPPARQAPARTPVRLTRRGRIVVTAAAVLTIGALSMVLAGAAQATGASGAPAGPGKGIAKVAVRPGQSLWSLAETYDPDADTRLVIQDILQLNSLTSDQVQPGQLLWVPRG